VFALLGLGDIVLVWVPLHFNSWQWEFGTIAASVSALPLASVGLACLLASLLARGRPWALKTIAILAVLSALIVLACLSLFATDVPLALRAAQGPAATGIRKGIVKTLVLGIGFGALYVAAALTAWRHSRERMRHGSH